MDQFEKALSISELSLDGETTSSDVSEIEPSLEKKENEIDNDLSYALDSYYDSYMEESERKIFECELNKYKEINENQLNETKDVSYDDFESELDSKYNSYIKNKDLLSFEKREFSEVCDNKSKTYELDSKIDNDYDDYIEYGEQQYYNEESFLKEHQKNKVP